MSHPGSSATQARDHFKGLLRWSACAMFWVTMLGCATSGGPQKPGVIELPLQSGWFEGRRVFYVTTDASDAQVAAKTGANHVPRLVNALPTPDAAPGGRTAVERIYSVTNFEQGGVLPSIPAPVGPTNRDAGYSPIWVLYRVTWVAGTTPIELRSEEQVLRVQEQGRVTIERTRIVVNCSVIQVEAGGSLPGSKSRL